MRVCEAGGYRVATVEEVALLDESGEALRGSGHGEAQRLGHERHFARAE